MMKSFALICTFGTIILIGTYAMHAETPAEKNESSDVSHIHASLPGGIITLKHEDSGMFFYVETNGRRLGACPETWIFD